MFLEAGCDRIGTSSAVGLLKERPQRIINAVRAEALQTVNNTGPGSRREKEKSYESGNTGRIAALRKVMERGKAWTIAWCLRPTSIIPNMWISIFKMREYLSGFTGSNGTPGGQRRGSGTVDGRTLFYPGGGKRTEGNRHPAIQDAGRGRAHHSGISAGEYEGRPDAGL